MNKKRILLCAAAASMIAISGAVLAINGGLKSSSVFATNGEVWHHYAAVAPTETAYGSKEFWASSIDGCTTHTFTDPGPGVTCIEHNFSTYDSFATLTCDDDRYVPSGNEALGITPMFSTKNNTVTYGLYPQKNVNDSTLVSALNELADSGLPEANGWYLYNNGYYAKVSATPYNEDSKIREFDNGTEIEEGTTYWFKCEPITWNVLSNNNSEYYILSSVLLDAHCYDASMNDEEIDDVTIHPNNYELSDIRAWLNKEFYNSAFALHNSYIQETTVDNSASTTDSSDNEYVCDNTQDNVFLPSYQDYMNSSYGFSTYESRYCKTTDWARARGAYCNRYSDYLYNGYYWTRSPSSILMSGAEYVNYDGTIQLDYTNYTYYSARPAISIKIA